MTEKRKTINGEDLIKAMHDLAFDQYLPHVEYYNKKYKDALKDSQHKAQGEEEAVEEDEEMGEIAEESKASANNEN